MTVSMERQAGSEHVIRSLIPARLDRLRWSRFHTRVVMALGVAWILDGLEITIGVTPPACSAARIPSTCRRQEWGSR